VARKYFCVYALFHEERMFRFYWRSVIRPNGRIAALLAATMLLASAFQMTTIGLAVPLLEAVRGDGSPSWVLDVFRDGLTRIGLQPTPSFVVFSVLVFASLLFLVYSGLLFLQQYLAAVAAERLKRETRLQIFERFLRGQYEVVANRGRGAILQDLTAPPNAIYTAIIRLSTLFSSIFNVAALLLLMLYLSWWATLFVALFGLIAIYGARHLMDARARSAGNTLYDLQSRESGLISDAIDGLKIVKAHALEGKVSGKLRSLLQAEIGPSLRVALFRYAPAFINECGAIAIVLVLGSLSLLRPSTGMGFPALVGFLLAIRQCGSSVASINALMAELQSVRRSVEVLPEVLDGIPLENWGTSVPASVSEIHLAGVSLQYADRSEILHEVDLTLRRGTVTAIVGPTGAGKTSIANLMVGLFRPTSGGIFVDGVPLEDLDILQWRKTIGYVSQDTFLFNASIQDNISLWNEAFSRSEIENASRLAQLHGFVTSLPEGYETVVGDRGLRLSGGQCQRIALARAILMRPAVLVLDEATSALDNLTESAVYEAMRILRPNAIVVAIAHRLSTIKDADQIVVLEGGRIAEVGTHGGLMSGGGSYSRLYEAETVRR
jgi:subfamily B ATP-binding cassette protein MsbA